MRAQYCPFYSAAVPGCTQAVLLSPPGPDPPVVSLVSELVAEYEHRVEAMCNIQPDAYEMGDNPIQWTNIGV